MNGRIPVTVVSGFLGSGKTTLLCDLLNQRPDLRLAVLINELGEVSIDGALARGGTTGTAAAGGGGDPRQVEIVDFPQGLIAYAEDAKFAPTMARLASRRGCIDHVLIETSGVALPTAVMARLQEPELSADFVLDAALTVVDVPLLLSGELDPGEGEAAAVAQAVGALFDLQLEQADVVVLNKIDGLGEQRLLEAEERIRNRAPGVRFVELAHDARLDARVALGLGLHQPGKTLLRRAAVAPVVPLPGTDWQPLADHGRVDGHSHSGLSAHAHGLATHTHFHEQDAGWLSFVLRSREAQDVARLRQAIAQTASSEPLLRCKGFVTDADGVPTLLQGVRARVVSGRAPGGAGAAAPRGGELVFIGYHLNRTQVASILTRATGTTWR